MRVGGPVRNMAALGNVRMHDIKHFVVAVRDRRPKFMKEVCGVVSLTRDVTGLIPGISSPLTRERMRFEALDFFL